MSCQKFIDITLKFNDFKVIGFFRIVTGRGRRFDEVLPNFGLAKAVSST